MGKPKLYGMMNSGLTVRPYDVRYQRQARQLVDRKRGISKPKPVAAKVEKEGPGSGNV